jgi:hypothetical protein
MTLLKESDDSKISRFERIIDQLTKMIDSCKKQNKQTRQQLEKEKSQKTELEFYLKKAVDKVLKEK